MILFFSLLSEVCIPTMRESVLNERKAMSQETRLLRRERSVHEGHPAAPGVGLGGKRHGTVEGSYFTPSAQVPHF